jgi:excisionase family DNA binding protein
MSSTERPTLSVAETAHLPGISRWLVQRAAHDGSLPRVRVGRRILIRRSRLVAWLDGQQDPGAPGPGRHSAGTRPTPASRC